MVKVFILLAMYYNNIHNTDKRRNAGNRVLCLHSASWDWLTEEQQQRRRMYGEFNDLQSKTYAISVYYGLGDLTHSPLWPQTGPPKPVPGSTKQGGLHSTRHWRQTLTVVMWLLFQTFSPHPAQRTIHSHLLFACEKLLCLVRIKGLQLYTPEIIDFSWGCNERPLFALWEQRLEP